MAFNTGAIIGQKLVSRHLGEVGTIADAYTEGARVWAVIESENPWEIEVTGCELKLNLADGSSWVEIA